MSALTVLVASFAAYRLTRLVVADKISERPIGWLEQRLPDQISYMLSCWWCAGMWVSFAVAVPAVLWADNRVVQIVGLGLALSTFVGLAAGLTEPDDSEAEFDPVLIPNVVGVNRDSMLDLRSSILAWVGDVDLFRARGARGVLSPAEAVAWEALQLIETQLSEGAEHR